MSTTTRHGLITNFNRYQSLIIGYNSTVKNTISMLVKNTLKNELFIDVNTYTSEKFVCIHTLSGDFWLEYISYVHIYAHIYVHSYIYIVRLFTIGNLSVWKMRGEWCWQQCCRRGWIFEASNISERALVKRAHCGLQPSTRFLYLTCILSHSNILSILYIYIYSFFIYNINITN